METEIASLEGNCNSIKTEITSVKEKEEKDSTVLKWISSHDIRGTYQTVLERTGLNDLYSNRCQWLIDHHYFETWYSAENDHILWLNGNMGTGKTTLMARAVREMKESNMVDVDTMGLAMFFFQKATGTSASLLSVETCLRSLVRQLSWDKATSRIEPAAERKHNELKNQRSDDSSLTTGDCLDLLNELILSKETYIMIDAMDECGDPRRLLAELKKLVLLANKSEHSPLHLMLCARTDLPVRNYFRDCLLISTGSDASYSDQDFYIDNEIDKRSRIEDGSLFFSPSTQFSQSFAERLKKILKAKACGLFRWIEVQIEIFTQTDFITSDAIEDELKRLETHTTRPELNEEYARLINRLKKSKPNLQRAIKLLRLLACCIEPMTAEELAEAITASEREQDRTGITAQDVRQILMGFVSESYEARNSRRPIDILDVDIPSKHVMRLAHASVLEYLTDTRLNTEDFSTLAQHTEATSLCFASISHPPRIYPWLKEGPESPQEETSFDHITMAIDGFFGYSCFHWPDHCKLGYTARAEDVTYTQAEDPECTLSEEISRFILSNAYWTWNKSLREFNRSGWGRDQIQDCFYVWHEGSQRQPGFVIAVFDLTELLEVSEIRGLIDPRHVNSKAQGLLRLCQLWGSGLTAKHLFDLYPAITVWNDDHPDILWWTFWKDLPQIAERLLESFGPACLKSEDHKLLYMAIHKFCHRRSEKSSAELESWRRIIDILLAFNVEIYNYEERWDSEYPLEEYPTPMFMATEISVWDGLITHSIKLEGLGLKGSVQKLLRTRDRSGRTAMKVLNPDDAQYLEKQLNEAVERDGEVLYDYDYPDIPGVRGGPVLMAELMDHLLIYHETDNGNSYLLLSPLARAADEYLRWQRRRYIEMAHQYRAKERKIGILRGIPLPSD